MILKEYTLANRNGQKLHKEITSSNTITNFNGIKTSGNTVSVLGDAIIDEVALDSIITNHVPVELDELKLKKHDEIFLKTNELLVAGSFVYDGKNFRLSDRALVRWVGVGVADLKSLVSFPYRVTTMQYEPYDIPSAQDFTTFFATGLVTAETIEGGGRVLHDAINAATTEAEVNAIIDNR